MAKTTEVFKRSIQHYIKQAADNNATFAKKVANPKKNIDDCITYILNQVKASKINGFEDSEIYGMAMHYYDEENIDIGKPVNVNQVVVNHQVELSKEEIESLKEKARQQVIDEEKVKMRKKKKPATEKAKPNSGDAALGTLF